MALPFSETWAGTNGDAWNASNWAISGNGIINDIQSNAGRMVTRPNGAYTDYNAALLADQASADFDLIVDLTVGSAENYPGVVFRTDGNWNGNAQPLNGFHLEFGVATNAVGLYRMDAGVRTSLAADTVTIQNSTVHVRIQCSGTTIRCRAWTGSEPSTWLFQPAAQTNHQTRTRHGLSVGNGAANQSATVVWDSLSVARFPFPAFKAAGAPQESITSPTVPWPTHAVGDVGLLLIESCGGEAANLSTAAGFAAVTNSPSSTGATTSGTRVTAYWCRATTTSQASPVVTDPGNHVYAVILTFTGCIASGNPWDVTAAAVKAAASTAMSMPSVTTTVANTLIVHVAARDNDSAAAAGSGPSNSNLASLTEQFDLGTALGNGGGLMVWTGERTATGATGATTATVTSSINAYLTVALKPPNPVVLANADPATATAAGNNATVNITGGLKTVTPTAATATGAGVNAVAGQATSCPAGVAAATGAAIGPAPAIRVSVAGDPLLAEDGTQLLDETGVGLRTEFGPDAVGVSYNAVAVATTGVSAGVATATGAANGSTPRVTANGGVATSTGAANTSTPAVGAAAGTGTGTGAGNSSTGKINVAPTAAAAAGAANTATPVIITNSGAGTASGAANQASGALRIAAAVGAATGAASNPAVSTNETADVEVAAAAGAANNSTPSIGARVGTGGGIGSANSSTGTITTTAAVGTAVSAANDAAANSAASVTANPVTATAAAAANGSTTTIVTISSVGSASGAANGAAGNLQPAPAAATSVGAANASAAAVASTAGTANGGGAAHNVAAGTASTNYVDAGAATATAAGLNSSAAVAVSSGRATAVSAAYGPSSDLAAVAAVAATNGQAYNADADSGAVAIAGLAAATGAANATTSTVVTGAINAAAAGVARNAVGQLPTVFLSSVLANVRSAEITVDVRVAA